MIRTLALLSAFLFAVRLLAVFRVGFGDSEALYACYALHLAPGYLDHPGCVGLLMRGVLATGSLTPARVHLVTTLLATAFPWFVYVCTRMAGAPRGGAGAAALLSVSIPELTVGLFAMTPDLPLAYAWTFALAMSVRALSTAPSPLLLALAGVSVGIASTSKATGLLLFFSLLFPFVRAHRAKVLFFAVPALLPLLPVVLHESAQRFPMLTHRLVTSQAATRPLWENALRVLVGQLGYVSPVAACLLVKCLWGLSPVLRGVVLVSGLPLLLFSIWSPVSEPHWLGPVVLTLVFASAWTLVPRRSLQWALGTGLAVSLLAHVFALTPLLPWSIGARYNPRADISNELYGVAELANAVRAEVATKPVPVIAPHWVLSAQLHAHLDKGVAVGSNTPIRDDFDTWLPRPIWRASEEILWVTDGRFATDPPQGFSPHSERTVTILRGGHTVRRFRILRASSIGGGT